MGRDHLKVVIGVAKVSFDAPADEPVEGGPGLQEGVGCGVGRGFVWSGLGDGGQADQEGRHDKEGEEEGSERKKR